MTRLFILACLGFAANVVAGAVGVVFYVVAGAVAVLFAVCVFDQVLCSNDGVIGAGDAISTVLRALGFRGFFRVLGFLSYFGFLGFLDYLGILSEVATGVLVGSVVVVAVGFLFFLLVIGVVVVGERRAMHVSAYILAAADEAPMTLRWVSWLLPGYLGTEWLAEETSFLPQACDEGERRRHVRCYRRGVQQLILTSWALHLRGPRSRPPS